MGSVETETPSSVGTTTAMASDSSSSGGGGTEKYEEKMASSGMGGQTSTSDGSGNAGLGYGGQPDEAGFAGTSAENERRTQGYGGDDDVDKTIGG